jgi:hypothetical protein
VEKYIIRKKKGISTISTTCGQRFTKALNNLSTCYPQSVDNEIVENIYPE